MQGALLRRGRYREVFEQPSHPYTQGLFGCLPDIESEESAMLHVIKGSMPGPHGFTHLRMQNFVRDVTRPWIYAGQADQKDMSIGRSTL